MKNVTHTLDQVNSEEYLNSLRYCLCGEQMTDDTLHHGCIQSGINCGIFKDIAGWREYCITNGKRVADYFRCEATRRHPIIKNDR